MENSLIVLIMIFIAAGLIKKVDLLETFFSGVKEAAKLVYTLFPSLLAFMLMVTLLESSGIVGYVTHLLSQLLPVSLPSSILGLALFRPVSSGASMAFLVEIFQQYGPDSFYGIMASLMQGATDTTLYVISIYFGKTHVKKTGYIVWLCLALDVVALLLAAFLTPLLFP